MSEKPLRILAIGAHAADQELSAGMILAKYARAGHQVTILSLTAGEKGHMVLDSAAYRDQKVREAQTCANVLGVKSVILDYLDAELPYNEAICYQVCDFIRDLHPDILITHWENSIHKDHCNAHRIALDARFYAGLKRIEREQPAHWVDKIYYSENWEDMDGYVPDVFVDTSDVFDQYCEALSSFELWNGGTGWPYSDYYRSLARTRACVGFAKRAQYASTLMRPKEDKIVRTMALP